MPDTIPVGKYYNFDNKNVDVVYNPDENKGGSGGGGVMVVNLHVEQDGGKTGRVNAVCNKTADEMFQAIETKSVVLKVESSETESATCMHIIAADNTDGYMFLACDVEGNRVMFTSMTADGYPSFST